MAHVAKYNASALGRMCGHYERSSEKHGYVRENIDNGKIGDNYNLAPARQEGQVAFINGRIEELGLKRRPRENAVRMCDCVVTAPPEVSDGELRKFFAAESEALSEMFGAENLVSAWVHLDEPGARPHMHWAWVPVTDDGRLSAKEVVSRAALRDLHPALQQAADKALGHHVQVVLDDGKRAAEYVGMAEYKAATAEARRAAEKASEARKAAETAERAQKAAEVRKRDSEAAAEASEKARKQAASAAEAAEKDLETQRRRAEQLGPEGKGIDWGHRAADGTWVTERHEKSLGEVRAERDAAQAEADTAMKKKDAFLAFADEIRGERYEIDGRTYKGITGLSDELKGLRAETAAAEKELAAAQGKAAAARRAAAEAEADRKAAEAAKAQAEALLSSLRDSEKEARARAQKWQERGLAHYHEMHLTPDDLLDALLIMARRVADVVCQLWVRARDIAVQEWDIWQTRDLPKAAGDMGIYIGDAFDISDRAMRETAEAYGHPEIADDLLDMPEQDQELGYDDWAR